MEVKGENNHVPVKERFGEEEKENTGLQQPSVSPQVKFGAAWVNQKVFLTQMTPLCLDNQCAHAGGADSQCSEELSQCCGLCSVHSEPPSCLSGARPGWGSSSGLAPGG